MPFRLVHALFLSIALHLLILALGTHRPDSRSAPLPATPAVLEALLTLAQDKPSDALLKDTIAATTNTVAPTPAPSDPAGQRRVTARAERRLAAHVYYPEAAVEQGLEGEVRLLLTLDEAGHILDSQIAASSGHTILDQAALDAARTMASLPGTGRREIILPVRFQLR
jgi:periplasmic protein TonB